MKSFSLHQLASLTGAHLVGDPHQIISGIDDLEAAGPEDASFCTNPRYLPLLKTTKAGVVCIHSSTSPLEGKNYLISDTPEAAFQTLIQLFLDTDSRGSGFSGIHPSAVIHPSAKIGHAVEIGPHAVIDQHCTIGDRTRIGASTVIGAKSHLGADCLIHPNVTIQDGSQIGNRVIIQPGAVIGSCGFGYLTDAQGIHHKLDQLGIVILEDDVEIGANTTIDRARFKETRIGKGTKIDNLVQIGHNVILGPHNIIVSQTGIAGSVKTGHHVVMGGQTGTVGHLEIAAGALFAARSGIKKSIKTGGKYGGNPAVPLAEHQREQVQLRNVGELSSKLKELEKRVDHLSSMISP